MPINRTIIVRGPAIVTWDGMTIYTAGDVIAKPVINTFKIATAFYGPSTDERAEQISYEIEFTPAGSVGAAGYITKVINPICALGVGDSVLGATDRPLVIHAKNGEKHTFGNAFPSKLSDVTFSSTKPLFGSCTFTAMVKNNTLWSAADSIHKIETATFADTSFDRTSIATGPYVASWGASSPFTAMTGAGDLVISIAPAWEPVVIDSDGIIDYRLADITGSARFAPIGVTLAQMKAAMVDVIAGGGRGASLGLAGKALTITGAIGNGYYPYFAADLATPTDAAWQFGTSVNRVGEVEFRLVRVAPAALCTFTEEVV